MMRRALLSRPGRAVAALPDPAGPTGLRGRASRSTSGRSRHRSCRRLRDHESAKCQKSSARSAQCDPGNLRNRGQPITFADGSAGRNSRHASTTLVGPRTTTMHPCRGTSLLATQLHHRQTRGCLPRWSCTWCMTLPQPDPAQSPREDCRRRSAPKPTPAGFVDEFAFDFVLILIGAIIALDTLELGIESSV